MKLFISWSKEPAKTIALELRGAIPMVLPAIKPWMSEVDIPKGGRWSAEIARELDETATGLIIVTSTNRTEPWLFFEAGALSKSVAEGKVHPLVVGVEKGDLIGPLAQFQATVFDRADFLKLLIALNRELPQPLRESEVESRFRRIWPTLEADIKTALAAIEAPSNHDNTSDTSSPSAGSKDVKSAGLSEELERVLRFLLSTGSWASGPTAIAVAQQLGIHTERAKYRLTELEEIDFVYVNYSVDGDAEYRLGAKGRRYAVENDWI